MRRIPPKVPKKTKHINLTRWGFWLALIFLASVAHSVWSELRAYQNRHAILIGASVDCIERPAWDYMAFCSPLHDGPACTHESRSRMIDWYEGIDYACAKTEPPKQFRFPVNREPETLEIAEVSG